MSITRGENLSDKDSPGRWDDSVTLYTIGHSNHDPDDFVELLDRHRIDLLVDVRSHPASGYVPHFNREVLDATLNEIGVKYTFGGEPLGGKPEEERFYDSKGRVLYRALAETDPFQKALQRVLRLARHRRTCIMCTEEDPAKCHRHLLISRAIPQETGVILHIRGDGAIETFNETEQRTIPGGPSGQARLPSAEEKRIWKSTRSASQKNQQKSSSND